ncbi:RNA ligase family protein [Weissella paramesenteroides]|nr:RNA ligase family protein [Weissella paramesenteroides]
MKFLKYPSLTNHYKVDERNFELNELMYATEKVDGSNVSITIDMATGEYKFGKRSGFIKDPDEKPFNVLPDLISHEDVDTMREAIDFIYDSKIVEAHIYGELYGDKIQRSNYDVKGKAVVLYDAILIVEDKFLQPDLYDLQAIVNDFMVETVSEPQPLGELLKQTPSEKSLYGGISEGLVYKPFKASLYDSNELEHYRVVKHKTDKYLEVRHVPKKHSQPHELSALAIDVERYVTDNRVMNVSSHGIELDFKNFGELSKAVKADIIKEYVRDEGVSQELVEPVVNKELNKQISTVIRGVINDR